VGRALGIGLNLLLNQLHAEFSGKDPGFCVLRVSIQCLTNTRQMHVGVPLYREHKVLVHLVAVPAAAIMWCNLVVPAQLLQAVSHRHPAPPPTPPPRRATGIPARDAKSRPKQAPRLRCAYNAQAPNRAWRSP